MHEYVRSNPNVLHCIAALQVQISEDVSNPFLVNR